MSHISAYQGFITNVDRAAALLALTDEQSTVLKLPERVLSVTFPVEMDDGTTRFLRAGACSTPAAADHARAASASIPPPTLRRSRRWPRG